MASRLLIWSKAFMYVCIGVAVLIAAVSMTKKVVPSGGYIMSVFAKH